MKKKSPVVSGALAIGAAVGGAASSEAATFNVTTNADAGAGSLRQAVADANANAGDDTITFAAALTGQTITLTTGDIDISDSLDIQGPGSADLTISGNDASRIFYIYNPSATPVTVSISGLTLTDGLASGAGEPATAGGAILAVGENVALDGVNVTGNTAVMGGGVAHIAKASVSGLPVPATLEIRDSTVSGNAAVFDGSYCGGGGGILVANVRNVLIADTTVANNAACRDGGGIFGASFYVGGELRIEQSEVVSNTAGTSDLSSIGGGVAALSSQNDVGATTIVDTTISGNESDYGGGFGAFDAALRLERSTIADNEAASRGGAAWLLRTNTAIVNSTIAGNTGLEGGALFGDDAPITLSETTVSGNITLDSASGTIYSSPGYNGDGIVSLANSIVANSSGAPDLDGSVFELAHTLVETPGTVLFTDLGGNVLNQDPQLGPLQDNGGPTETMKPAFSSPVVNAGDSAFAPPPATDQRGFARVAGGRIDMGSVELNGGTLQFSVATQNVNEADGTATVTVTRTGGIDGAASVQVPVNVASTATGGGSDYTLAPVTLNWADNDSSTETFNVTIVNDTTDEPSETIVLDLVSPVGAAPGAPATHTITIVDDDLVADLNVTKTLAPGPLLRFGNATFVITVRNDGPDAATNVVITDTLPPEVTFVSADPSCTGTTTVTCSVGALASGASASVQIVVSLPVEGAVTNTANAGSDMADPDGADDQGSVTFTVGARALESIPALDPRMLMVLAALLGLSAAGIIRRS